MSLPPIPSWDAVHPLVVHFPVALLLTVPIFILLGLVLRNGRGFLLAALVLMVLGTVAAWVAVATGEAAGELASRTPAITAALERHEEAAETTRDLFTLFTAVFAALLLVPPLLRKQPGRRLTGAVGVVFLAGYLGGAVMLADTAHEGGQLVHVHGVHALMPLPATPVAAPQEGSGLLQMLQDQQGQEADPGCGSRQGGRATG